MVNNNMTLHQRNSILRHLILFTFHPPLPNSTSLHSMFYVHTRLVNSLLVTEYSSFHKLKTLFGNHFIPCKAIKGCVPAACQGILSIMNQRNI